MQKSRAVIIVSITAVVTLLLLAGTVFAVFYKPAYKGQTGQGRLYLEFLKEHSEPEWHTMWEQLWDLNEYVEVPKSAFKDIAADDKTAATLIIEHIASYAFWVDDGGTHGQYEFSSDDKVVTVHGIKYFDNAKKMKVDVEVALIKVFNKVYVQGSPVSTIRNINKFLYENTAYGEDSSMGGQTIYSVLIDKEAVCGGFARTFNTLALMADIDSTIVAGYLLKNEGPIRHAWNVYTIDGVEYVTDSTANRTSGNISKVLHMKKSQAKYLQSYLNPEVHAFAVKLYD